jgi:hypothetical protein
MSRNDTTRRAALSIRRERGVVLFVALIAMVILSLAGIGLMRSVDTGQGVVGNLAFRQASIAPVNLAIERAVSDLFKTRVIASTVVNDLAHRYYATLQPGETATGVPAVLAGPYPPSAYDALFGHDTDPTTKLEVRAIIERVCNAPAATQAEMIEHCDLMPPKVSPAGTDNEPKRIPLPPIPHFRVTVRVDWPNTNTVTFAQAFLR